MHNNRKDNL